MGRLIYGGSKQDIDFDDRALYHLQIVIVAKLRRKESFLFSWAIAREEGGGRNSVWLDPQCMLVFSYVGSRIPSMNRAWVHVLMESANSTGGLFFTPEPTGPGVER